MKKHLVTVRTRSGARRCAFCHAELDARTAEVCPSCDASYHRACFRELARCPTLGCDGVVPLAAGAEERLLRGLGRKLGWWTLGSVCAVALVTALLFSPEGGVQNRYVAAAVGAVLTAFPILMARRFVRLRADVRAVLGEPARPMSLQLRCAYVDPENGRRSFRGELSGRGGDLDVGFEASEQELEKDGWLYRNTTPVLVYGPGPHGGLVIQRGDGKTTVGLT